jgi:ABC-type glycerol-3-phosphate transport system substrate-binding protein
MRKFKLLSLVLAGALALSACGNNASAGSERSDRTEREEDDREDEDREDVDRESQDADGESQQPVKDWGYPLILPEYIIGEVTVGENVYTVCRSEDLFTDEPR